LNSTERDSLVAAAADHKRLAQEARANPTPNLASIAQAVRIARVEAAVMAASNVWAIHQTPWRWRPPSKYFLAWDLSCASLATLDALDHDHNDTRFSHCYHLFQAFEAGAFGFFTNRHRLEVYPLPSLVRLDEIGRLHSATGPAFEWLDELRDYYWHGVRVPSYVVDHPKRLTVADIEAETNVEVRRVKMERFGQARFLLATGARALHQDDYGTLYRKEVPGEEPLQMVRVVNATAELDDSFKDYFIRVPPTMQTAREAVAWTFGKTAAEYDPATET